MVILKTKGGAFCVRTGTIAGDCTTYKQEVWRVTVGGPGTDYRYYPTWDGDPTECTRAGNWKCTAQTKLISDGL